MKKITAKGKVKSTRGLFLKEQARESERESERERERERERESVCVCVCKGSALGICVYPKFRTM